VTAAIISYMEPGEERGDARRPARTLFAFCRTARCARSSRANVGALTLARARDAALKKRLQRDPGKDPQLEKRNKRAEATRERITEKQAAYSVSDLVEQNVRCSPCRSAEEKLHAASLSQSMPLKTATPLLDDIRRRNDVGPFEPLDLRMPCARLPSHNRESSLMCTAQGLHDEKCRNDRAA
jgi:hypothetical protein